MTTIAYKAGVLAADRQVTCGTSIEGRFTKIVKRADGAMCGVTGASSLCAGFIRWFLDNGAQGQPDMVSRLDSNQRVEAVIVRPDGKLECHEPNGWFEFEAECYAIGSGGDFATGAMAAGLGAEEAVRLAMRYDSLTGGGVDVLKLDNYSRAAETP